MVDFILSAHLNLHVNVGFSKLKCSEVNGTSKKSLPTVKVTAKIIVKMSNQFVREFQLAQEY